jgi:hypothetical protein
MHKNQSGFLSDDYTYSTAVARRAEGLSVASPANSHRHDWSMKGNGLSSHSIAWSVEDTTASTWNPEQEL